MRWFTWEQEKEIIKQHLPDHELLILDYIEENWTAEQQRIFWRKIPHVIFVECNGEDGRGKLGCPPFEWIHREGDIMRVYNEMMKEESDV